MAYTRNLIPPRPLKGGKPGSSNHTVIRRKSGELERYSSAGAISLNTDGVIQIMSAAGAGWGIPTERDTELVKADVKNGCITPEQAKRAYGVEAAA